MGRNQRVTWYYGSNTPGFWVESDVGAANDVQRMLIDTNGVRFQNQNGLSNFFIHNEPGSITGRLETTASTSANPTLLAGGSATDINIVLTPKGSGSVVSTDGFLSNDPTKANGYTTGSGGTVTQATNKTTGVTLNKVTGQITMNNAALANNDSVIFTLTNSTIGANDTVSVCHSSGGGTANNYVIVPLTVASGSVGIRVTNISGGNLSEAVMLQFNVHRGAAS